MITSLTTFLFLIFLVLKLVGVIAWSWLWVTAPLWLNFVAGKQNPINHRLVLAYFTLCKKPFESWKIDPRNKKRRRRQIQRHSAR